MESNTEQQPLCGLSPKVSYNFDLILSQLIGKRVFIFDLETSGLFDFKNHHRYFDNKVFDCSRIVEIGYYYTECFELDDFNKDQIIHSYLRKPTDFDNIDEQAMQTHSLTIEHLQTHGFTFSKILNNGLLKILNNVDYIVSHNTMFDFNVLLNELFRFKLTNTIKYLLNIKKTKRLLCTCRASGFTKLNKLYEKIFAVLPQTSHRAGEDVQTLIEIIIRKQMTSPILNVTL